MYKYIIMVLVTVSLGLVSSQQKEHDHGDYKMDGKTMKTMDHDTMGTIQKEEGMHMMHDSTTTMYYTCPMESHKHVHNDEPGKCTECGMTLVAVEAASVEEAEFYGCPMEIHSHVRSDKPGECDECGMTLEPMKLKKRKM